ncbi:MAG: hypothetical protein VYC96_07940, partial [Actinomycetota bacterium]|nr:hypothetical protein [Actinomycetota bacterium]
VVDVAGEYDPFAGKPGAGLKLVSLSAGARCDIAALSAAGDRAVAVSWPAGGPAPGGQCTVPFTVADAQGRTGGGTLTLDLQGYPQAPASLTTIGFGRSSVELEVALGEAARAHPALTGVTILRDGAPAGAACRAAGSAFRCTVNGLVNGVPHSFTAAAVNAVGTSAVTSAHTSWAYEAPVNPNATATPVYRHGGNDRGRGVVSLAITAANDARAFRVAETGDVIARTGATTTAELKLAPGAQTITLVPVSQFQPPTGGGNEGASYPVSVTVAGAPYFDPAQTQATAVSNTAVNVSGISPQANGSTEPLEVTYLAWRSGRATCSADDSGDLTVSGAEVASPSPSLQGLEAYQAYNVKACVSNGYGVAESSTARVFTFTFVDGPGGDTTYRISEQPTRQGDRYTYPLASAPSIDVEPGFVAQYQMYGSWRGDFTLSAAASPGQVRARACHATETDRCSDTVNITATTAPTIVEVDFAPCLSPTDPSEAVSVSAAARGSYRVTAAEAADAPGSFDVTLSWNGAYATLSPITRRMPGCP